MPWKTNRYDKLPPAPKYSIHRFRRNQQKVKEYLLERWAAYGRLFQGTLMERLSEYIFSRMEEYSENDDLEYNNRRVAEAVDAFLQPLVGRHVDELFVDEVSIKLAEWLPSFEEAIYEPWEQRTPVWALVYVLDVERQLTEKGRRYICRFQSLAGPSASMFWDSHMTGGQIQQLLRDAGLPKFDKYSDEEIGGMYLIAYLQPDDRRINIGEVTFSSSVQTHNKGLLRKRQEPCSGGFWIGPCINCPFGRKDCALARHEKLYDEKLRCENFRTVDGGRKHHKGYKILRSQGVCLDCLNKGRFRPEALRAYRLRYRKFKPGKSGLGVTS